MVASMRSGGVIKMDDKTCIVDMTRFFLELTQEESFNKCTPCREGTKRMLKILERNCDGKSEPKDIPLLQEVAEMIIHTIESILTRHAVSSLFTKQGAESDSSNSLEYSAYSVCSIVSLFSELS